MCDEVGGVYSGKGAASKKATHTNIDHLLKGERVG